MTQSIEDRAKVDQSASATDSAEAVSLACDAGKRVQYFVRNGYDSECTGTTPPELCDRLSWHVQPPRPD